MANPGWAMPNGPQSTGQTKKPSDKAMQAATKGAFAGVQPTQVPPTKINPKKVTPKTNYVSKGSPDQADVHVMGSGKLKKVSWPKYVQAVRRK